MHDGRPKGTSGRGMRRVRLTASPSNEVVMSLGNFLARKMFRHLGRPAQGGQGSGHRRLALIVASALFMEQLD